jgi:hypothetical protein
MDFPSFALFACKTGCAVTLADVRCHRFILGGFAFLMNYPIFWKTFKKSFCGLIFLETLCAMIKFMFRRLANG